MQYRRELNILMQPLSLKHGPALYNLTNSNREYLREWLPWLDRIKSISDTNDFIKSAVQESASGGAPHFALLYKDAVCGIAGFHKLDKANNLGSIGYWLAQEHNRKGIVTEAVKELLNIGFGELRLNKIEIRCAEKNSKSRAIPERLGFTYEATLRQRELLYTKYMDHVVYSMLASEYNAQYLNNRS